MGETGKLWAAAARLDVVWDVRVLHYIMKLMAQVSGVVRLEFITEDVLSPPLIPLQQAEVLLTGLDSLYTCACVRACGKARRQPNSHYFEFGQLLSRANHMNRNVVIVIVMLIKLFFLLYTLVWVCISEELILTWELRLKIIISSLSTFRKFDSKSNSLYDLRQNERKKERQAKEKISEE